MIRVRPGRDLTGQLAALGERLKEKFSLEEPPRMVYWYEEGALDVDLPDDIDKRKIKRVVDGASLVHPSLEWQSEMAELLDREDELTEEEDLKLTKLQRRWIRNQLGE